MKTKKTAREKMKTITEARLVEDPKGRGRMLIPRPLDVDALVRKIPKGKLATISQVRERLARDCHADLTCPLTAGIFLRIVAEAVEEDLAEGKKNITPYWRAVKDDGSLNEKFPGGTYLQSTRLKEEGHSILPGKGKKPPRVQDFEKFLHKL